VITGCKLSLQHHLTLLPVRQVAALLDNMTRQQQQQQYLTETELLVSCTAAMLSAAAGMLRETKTATKLQLARACVTSGVLDRVAAAMCDVAAQLQTADADAQAALEAGNGLPLQYRQQQRAVPASVQLAMELIRLFDELGSCWPGPLLLSTQASIVVLPAAQLLLAATQFALRLLAGNNRELSCKLLGVCLKPALAVAVLAMSRESYERPEATQLLRSLELQQLQLLLLMLAVKIATSSTHPAGCLSAAVDGGSSSSCPAWTQHGTATCLNC
jgi:hypothetical protein